MCCCCLSLALLCCALSCFVILKLLLFVLLLLLLLLLLSPCLTHIKFGDCFSPIDFHRIFPFCSIHFILLLRESRIHSRSHSHTRIRTHACLCLSHQYDDAKTTAASGVIILPWAFFLSLRLFSQLSGGRPQMLQITSMFYILFNFCCCCI